MSFEPNLRSDAVAQLQEGLRAFESLGCGRPTAASLQEYLEQFVNAQVLSKEDARQIVLAFNVYRYGGTSENDPLPQALTGLQVAAEKLRSLDPEKREQIARQLRERFSLPLSTSPPARQSEDLIKPAPAAVVSSEPFSSSRPPTVLLNSEYDPFPSESDQVVATSTSTKSGWLRQRWGVLAVLGAVLWTFGVLVVGYLRHDGIQEIVTDLRNQFAGNETDSQRPIKPNWNVRESRPAPIPEIERFMRRARAFDNSQQPRLAMNIYEVVLAIDPNHAEANNNLAWTLLTCPDASLRDPVRALPFAKTAVQVEPNFAYIDTLAEAWFQNGEPAKAVELEEQALNKAEESRAMGINPNVAFLRKQLERFRQGVDKSSGPQDSEIPVNVASPDSSPSPSATESREMSPLSVPPEPPVSSSDRTPSRQPDPPPLPE